MKEREIGKYQARQKRIERKKEQKRIERIILFSSSLSNNSFGGTIPTQLGALPVLTSM